MIIKRKLYIPVLVLLFLSVLVLSFEPVGLILTKRFIKKRFAADIVIIGRFQVVSIGEFSLKDILIEKKSSYRVKAAEFRMGINVFSLFNKDFDRLIVQSADVNYDKLQIKNLNLKLDRFKQDSHVTIAKVGYGKISVFDLSSPAQLKGLDIIFSGISANFLNGRIGGTAKMSMIVPLPEYRAHLQFFDLSIIRMINDFEFQKKIEMTGTLDGDAQIIGQGQDIRMLAGGFRTDEPGGKLIIKDRKMLENVVDRAYLDTVVETLQNYDYNAGGLVVSLEGNDLVADIQLDGANGKRNFNVVYHR